MGEHAVLGGDADAAMPPADTLPSRLQEATALFNSCIGQPGQSSEHSISTFGLAHLFTNPALSPLDAYRVAACLHERQLKQMVQFMVFAGPHALLPALRLLNLMRGLPGNWELTVELLEQQQSRQLAMAPQRALTLIALLGGKKAYRLCDWSLMLGRTAEVEGEEARLAFHMLTEKKWKGPIERVLSVVDWTHETPLAGAPSIWREIKWASYARDLCTNRAAEDLQSARTVPADADDEGPCITRLSDGEGMAAKQYVDICGFLLRLRPTGDSDAGAVLSYLIPNDADVFVVTPNVKRTLRAMAGALCYGMPVVLEGSTGCGKTSLISYLARSTASRQDHPREVPGVTFIQMDSAMSEADGDSFTSLIGTVVPLPEGGGFRWRLGPIGVAVERGDWLVFENIGCPSSRSSSALAVISELATLRAGDCLDLSGREQPLKVGMGFRCIATRTTFENSGDENWEPPGVSAVWERIPMQALSMDERVEILKRRYENVVDCVERVVRATELVAAYVHTHRGPLLRKPTFRESVCICKRLSQLRSEDIGLLTVENAALETLDVLSAWCPSEAHAKALIHVVSECWSLPNDVGIALTSHHRPDLTDQNSVLRVGRASMVRLVGSRVKPAMQLTLTGHTRRMLERTMRCLQLGEHVLLTGEAGSGKTSLIQELARMLSRRLVVINLSKQSELEDLLGGFRPVELSAVVTQLAKQFEETFCLTVSRKKNGRFLDALQKASRAPKHHSRALLLMSGAMKAIPKGAMDADASIAQNWKSIGDQLHKLSDSLQIVTHPHNSGETSKPRNEPLEPPRKRQKGVKAESSHESSQRECTTRKRPRAPSRRVDFQFSEGALVRAMRDGQWVLLDEINLAPSDLLERLVSVMDRGQVMLPDENGTVVSCAEGFRLFGAMNPPTDVGKRPLPLVLRTRFSELYVRDTMEREDIVQLTMHRLFGCTDIPDSSSSSSREERVIADDVAAFFVDCCKGGADSCLQDASGKPARFSIRNLARMLDFARGLRKYVGTNLAGVRRALFEGAILSFATSLPTESRTLVAQEAMKVLLRVDSQQKKVCLSKDVWDLGAVSQNQKPLLRLRSLEGFPVEISTARNEAPKGDTGEQAAFVLSPTVRRTLQDVSRALTFGTPRLPVLLQGPTAAGKTSLVSYLAGLTGNKLVRINNHEHTDLSEYIGAYVVTTDGSMVFHEGPLVQAARNGSWVLLDELNLAPPEVLESLNRLLDDNREILITETGDVVRAADGFRVFATQNPPGLYGGRKELSRAFRSRFVEIQVPDLPDEDLRIILEGRCNVPMSFARSMIAVMRELQMRRRTTGVFAGREGFVTARDLFRWASRGPRSKDELAIHGFLLLGERSRLASEREVVRKTILKTIGVSSDVLADDNLFSFGRGYSDNVASRDCLEYSLHKLGLSLGTLSAAMDSHGIAQTSSMRRMITLVTHAVANKEPCLLVGATGGGKTSCCSVISDACNLRLRTINCHRHSEASDILGNFRPVRARKRNDQLFEWVDGPLVRAMKEGSFLLVDEINMCEDAVVERLNSVLELERTLLLSEKGSIVEGKGSKIESLGSEVITSHSHFRVLATMNPGGDFGKKELSPALRNRFTEVWIAPPSSMEDYVPVVHRALSLPQALNKNAMEHATKAITEVLEWALGLSKPTATRNGVATAAQKEFSFGSHFVFSMRDVSAWCNFVITAVSKCKLAPMLAVVHGARLVFLDGMSVGSTSASDARFEKAVWQKLVSLVPLHLRKAAEDATFRTVPKQETLDERHGGLEVLSYGVFGIPKNPDANASDKVDQNYAFSFEAPCTGRNSARLARAMSLGCRPILLEGPPGCGKSSLIAALANVAGFGFLRVNLSESTEMSDLVGADAPGDVPGTFSFREGLLLLALRKGLWILLDELNLASQSVLEGLNSVLDHRRSIYVPELNQEFYAHTNFRLFGAQNPACEGGGRRGLPKSFLNRFNRVQVETPSDNDILVIIQALHPGIKADIARGIVEVLRESKCELELAGHRTDISAFGLRDALRWCDLLGGLGEEQKPYGRERYADRHLIDVGLYFDVVVLQGLQNSGERRIAERVFQNVFGCAWQSADGLPSLGFSCEGLLRLGRTCLAQGDSLFQYGGLEPTSRTLQPSMLRVLQAMSLAVNAGWPVVICPASPLSVQSECEGLVHSLARMAGKPLRTIHGATLSDCEDFVGGYSQHDMHQELASILETVERMIVRGLNIYIGSSTTPTSVAAIKLQSALAHETKLRSLLQSSSSSETFSQEFLADVTHVCKSLCSFLKIFDHGDAAFAQDEHTVQHYLSRLQTLNAHRELGSGMSFEWRKSDFIRAVERGEWILLESADLCSPAILDRLNPVLERPPVAVVDGSGHDQTTCPKRVILAEAPPSEDGSPVFLMPHPDFRIFFSLSLGTGGNSFNGLSRALLDRSLKICVGSERVRESDASNNVKEHAHGGDDGNSEREGFPDHPNVPRLFEEFGAKQRVLLRYWMAKGGIWNRDLLLPFLRAYRTTPERNSDYFPSRDRLSSSSLRTHVADLALCPLSEIGARDVGILRATHAEALVLFEGATSSAVLSSLHKGLNALKSEIGTESFQRQVPDMIARGFILGSQSQKDLAERCQILRLLSEQAVDEFVRRAYVNVANLAAKVCESIEGQEAITHSSQSPAFFLPLPIDPLFALDFWAARFVNCDLPSNVVTTAKRFRLEILAVHEFRAAWEKAVHGVTSGQSSFSRAKRSFEVGQLFSGGRGVGFGTLAYCVLHQIAIAAKSIARVVQQVNGWELPDEEAVINIFRSAKELLDVMLNDSNVQASQTSSLLQELLALSRRASKSIGSDCFGISVPESLREQVKLLKNDWSKKQLFLMPRTKEAQEVEERLLQWRNCNQKVGCTLHAMDALTKGLACLLSETVEGSEEVLDILRNVGSALQDKTQLEQYGADRLCHWKRASAIHTVNLLQKVVLDLDHRAGDGQEKAVFEVASTALFHAKCADEIRLPSVIALQQYIWILDALSHRDSDLQSSSWEDLKVVMMSNLLTEKAAIWASKSSVAHGIGEPERDFGGILLPAMKLSHESSLSQFWNLPFAKEESLSAALLSALGKHVVSTRMEEAERLLMYGLRLGLEFAESKHAEELFELQERSLSPCDALHSLAAKMTSTGTSGAEKKAEVFCYEVEAVQRVRAAVFGTQKGCLIDSGSFGNLDTILRLYGAAWFSIGLLRLQAFHRNMEYRNGLDPVEEAESSAALSYARAVQAAAGVTAFVAFGGNRLGGDSQYASIPVNRMGRQLGEQLGLHFASEKRVVHRPSGRASFSSFSNTVSGLNSSIVHKSARSGLLSSLVIESTTPELRDRTWAEAQDLYESCGTAAEALEVAGPLGHFRDLSAELLLGLREVQYGLSCCMRAIRLAALSSDEHMRVRKDLFLNITRFPRAAFIPETGPSISTVLESCVAAGVSPRSIMVCATYLVDCEVNGSDQNNHVISEALSFIVRRWKENMLSEEGKEERKNSLHVLREAATRDGRPVQSALEQLEVDAEQDFADTFNSISTDLEEAMLGADTMIDEKDRSTGINGEKKNRSIEFLAMGEQFWRIHELAFPSHQRLHSELFARSLAVNAITTELPSLSEGIHPVAAHSSSPFDIFLCASIVRKFDDKAVDILDIEEKKKSGIDGKSYDFYKDGNPKELILASAALRDLQEAVSQVQEKYFGDSGDHPVLGEISSAITRVSKNCTISSSLSAVVLGLENVLRKADEWRRIFATSTTKMEHEVVSLSRLVARWRRLEMDSWQSLISSRIQAQSDNACRWMFFLYDAVVHEAMSKNGGGEDCIRGVVSVLDKFLRSSPCGEFSKRLDMIFSLSRHILSVACDRSEVRSLGNALHGIGQYYQLFSSTVSADTTAFLDGVDKKLKDFSRLVSWDPKGNLGSSEKAGRDAEKHLEYFRLKSAAERTKRKLHSFCLEVDTFLRTPVYQFLTKEISRLGFGTLAIETGENCATSCTTRIGSLDSFASLVSQSVDALTGEIRDAYNSAPEQDEVLSLGMGSRLVGKLAMLQKKVMEYGNLSETSVDSNCGIAVVVLQELRALIGVRVSALKEAKNIDTQPKKRALVDLLRALQRLGLSPFQKAGPSVLDSYTWLASPDPSNCEAYNKIACQLFYTSAQQLRRLREVADSRIRNLDITAGEAQKAVSFCSDLFANAVEERTCLNGLICDISYLFKASHELVGLKELNEPSKQCFMLDHGRMEKMHDTVIKLKKIRLDMEFSRVTLRSALEETEEKFPRPCVEKADALIREQISSSRKDILRVSEVLGKGLADIGACLSSENVTKFDTVNWSRQIIDGTWSDAFTKARRELRTLGNALDSSLMTAETISEHNLAERVLRPTSCFVRKSLAALDVPTPRKETRMGTIPAVQIAELNASSETLIEHVLVGSQNIMKWNAVSQLSDAQENPKSDVNACPSSWPAKVLKRAHIDVTIAHIRSHTKKLGSQLQKNAELLNKLLVHCDLAQIEKLPEVSQLFAVQRRVGSLIVTYAASTLLPCAAKASSFHCHSLSLLRSLSSVFVGLCLEGYCRPGDDPQGEEHGGTEDQGGVGFGEAGDGDLSNAQDVSAEVEDEEQLLGLQDDIAKESNKNNTAEQSSGVEMTADFDGDIGGMDGEADGENEQDSMAENQMSEQNGEGDDFVDERLWKGESDTAENPGDRNGEDDAGNAGEDVQELVAKDTRGEAEDPANQELEGRRDERSPPKKQDEDRASGQRASEEDVRATEDDMLQDNGSKDSLQGADRDTRDDEPRGDNDNAEQQSRVDGIDSISGDRDTGADDSSHDHHQNDMESQEKFDNRDEAASSGTTAEQEGINPKLSKETDNADSEGEGTADDAMTGADVNEVASIGADANGSAPVDPEENAVAATDDFPENMSMDGMEAGHEEEQDSRSWAHSEKDLCEDGNVAEVDKPSAHPLDSTETTNTDENQDFAMPDTEQELDGVARANGILDEGVKTTDHDTAALDPETGSKVGTSAGMDTTTSTGQNVKASGPGESEGHEAGQDGGAKDGTFRSGKRNRADVHGSSLLPEANPMRAAHTQPEDLVKSWSKHLNLIQGTEDDTVSGPEEDKQAVGGELWKFMEVKNADNDIGDNDKLVLAAATEDQHRPLPAAGCEDAADQEPAVDDKRDKIPEETRHLQDFAPDATQQLDADGSLREQIQEDQDGFRGEEKKDNRSDSPAKLPRKAKDAVIPKRNPVLQENNDLEPMGVDDYEMQKPQEENGGLQSGGDAASPGHSVEGGALRWQNLIQKTWVGANMLCEQLRLVLEPTVTSGLAGGFRTGKRLNIRRVIEFVASDFRKDRIWLRRVRPDKRSYDVLLAIDDSESMSESGAGQMALEALALVASALSKLEVGRLAVAGFGMRTEMVRGFDEPLAFSDIAGGQLLSRFQFSQPETDVGNLLSFVQVEMGDLSKSASVEQVKLAFVVSDGRLSNREEVKRQLRKLRELHVLVAFIIIDKAQANEASIFEVRRVEYTQSGQVQVMPYMQDFPIEFYTVLQDVQQLPLVLADALRQWIELTSTQL